MEDIVQNMTLDNIMPTVEEFWDNNPHELKLHFLTFDEFVSHIKNLLF